MLGRWDKVRVLAPLAVNLAPFDAAVHVAHARALAHGDNAPAERASD